jgi:sulfur dioxygenase
MIFRQLFDPQSSTYTYLVAESASREALLIDPVFEQAQRDATLIKELGLRLKYTLETHVHADHVTGAWLLKDKLGSRIALSAASGAHGADVYLQPQDRIAFGRRHLEARPTSGHTNGCMTYVLDDRTMAFTGDTLFIRGCGRTDFQGGDSATLYRSVHERIFTLPDETLIYPGHDYRQREVSSVGEERAGNARLGGGRTVEEFAAIMAGLDLPRPKKIDVAVPANRRCGLAADQDSPG